MHTTDECLLHSYILSLHCEAHRQSDIHVCMCGCIMWLLMRLLLLRSLEITIMITRAYSHICTSLWPMLCTCYMSMLYAMHIYVICVDHLLPVPSSACRGTDSLRDGMTVRNRYGIIQSLPRSLHTAHRQDMDKVMSMHMCLLRCFLHRLWLSVWTRVNTISDTWLEEKIISRKRIGKCQGNHSGNQRRWIWNFPGTLVLPVPLKK